MTKLGYIAIIVCAVIVIRFVWAIVCCAKEQKAKDKKAKEKAEEKAEKQAEEKAEVKEEEPRKK